MIHDVRVETRWFTTESRTAWHVLVPGDRAACRANIRPCGETYSDTQREAFPLPIPRCLPCTRKVAGGVPVPGAEPGYVTVRDAHLPAAVDGWNGQTYHKREVAAMNVRHGDRVVFWDMTGERDLYGIATVKSIDFDRSAHKWERVTLYVSEWRGADNTACELKTWTRPMVIRYGTRTRVTVWRAA